MSVANWLHAIVRPILFRDPWAGLLVEFQWFRKYIGGTWQQWIMDQPIGGEAWFRWDRMDARPHPLCRGTPTIEYWPNNVWTHKTTK